MTSVGVCDNTSYYGQEVNASKVFNIVNCFQNLDAGCNNWTGVYCYSLCIYCTAASVNIVILSMLLRVAKKSLKTSWGDAFRKPKIWICATALALNVALLVHYFFE